MCLLQGLLVVLKFNDIFISADFYGHQLQLIKSLVLLCVGLILSNVLSKDLKRG